MLTAAVAAAAGAIAAVLLADRPQADSGDPDTETSAETPRQDDTPQTNASTALSQPDQQQTQTDPDTPDTDASAAPSQPDQQQTQSAASRPDRPTRPALTPGDGRIAVSWDAPADNGDPITRYEVDWGAGSAGTSSSSYRIAGLANGRTYTVRVRARNSVGWSDWSQTSTAAPQRSDNRFAAVSAGDGHSCGLRRDGTAQCWGHNHFGESDAPGGTFAAVSAGAGHSCGLRRDGTAQCWGYNDDGRSDAPGGTFAAVSAGDGHSCGLRRDGTAQCWGPNGFGESDAPGGTFAAVSAGTGHSCGLRRDGTAQCWGRNHFGESDAPGG